MKTFKYTLPWERGSFKGEGHRIHTIRHIHVIDEQPYFWALVYDDMPKIPYVIHALHTGEDDKFYNAGSMIQFIGTAILHNGSYVLHYYIERDSYRKA